MLEVFLTRNSEERVWLKLPSTPAEEGEIFATLDAIESENLETRISKVVSSVRSLHKYIRGKILTSQTLVELCC